MHNITDFYDKLDLKYPEIGIAMEDIDKSVSSKVKFVIPVLTPNMDNSRIISQTIHQNKMNLMNDSKSRFEIDDILFTNYIKIPVPKEICGSFISDEDRYIKKGSKWIIVFVGGDITKPRAIARYLE